MDALAGFSDEELFSMVEQDKLASEKITAPKYSYWHSVFRVFFKKKINIFMLVLLAAIVLFAYLYPAFVEYDKYGNLLNSASKHLSPTKAFAQFGFNVHWLFGSGAAGQSTFDAVWYGARISISLAAICALINLTVGVLIGTIWGFSNLPYILFIAVMVMLFSASFWTMVFAMTITGWISIAYFIRTQVIIIRDREYNLASRCLGTSIFRIATRNILPFMTSVIVTLAATEIPSYISYESFLSYIGLGISDMSLGRLIYESQNSMLTPGWGFEFWSPVVVVSLITIVLYVVGQNLGDASDPRTHV